MPVGHLCDHCGDFQAGTPLATYEHRMTFVDDDGSAEVRILKGTLCEDCAIAESHKQGLIQTPEPSEGPAE